MAVSRKAKPQKSKGRCYNCCGRGRTLRSATFWEKGKRLAWLFGYSGNGNNLCLDCRTLNACGIQGHTHVNIGDKIRIPRKKASEHVWKRFLARFDSVLSDPTKRHIVGMEKTPA